MPGGMPQLPDALGAVDEGEDVRELLLRMARLAQRGRLEAFATLVAADPHLDETTRECVLVLANEPFLASTEPRLARRYNRSGRAISSVG
jgi:hypothetical protein